MVCCGGGATSVGPEGEKRQHDPDFNGPMKNRSCTDIVFLIVFILFWVGLLVIAGIALKNGDPGRIIYGADSYGNVCGKDNDKLTTNANSGLDLTSRKYLFYFKPGESTGLKLCVEACPSADGTGTSAATAAGLCLQSPYQADAFESGKGVNFNIDSSGCPITFFESHKVLHRCVPSTDSSTAESIIGDLNLGGVWANVVADLTDTWPDILVLCAISLAVAFLMVFVMRLLAPILIWVTYILLFVATAGFIAYLWIQYRSFKKDYDDTPPEQRLDADKQNVRFYFWAAIIWSVLGGIILIILIVMRSRIALVVALFKEASRTIGSMPMILFMPVWTYIAIFAVIAYFLFIYMYLYTCGDAKEDATTHQVTYENSKDLVKMQWYHVFGFLWTTQFLIAYQECAVAGAVASYYFTRDKGSLHFPVVRSVYRVFRYHLGSIAFGSFIIAVVKFARLILAYFQKKLHGKAGKIVNLLLKCLQCCLWCFEKCLKFLNRNAYIEIAIYGYSFCKAARTAFMLLLRNVLRVAALNSIGDLVLFICKLLITLIMGLAALYWFQKHTDINYVAVPVFLVCVFAYIIASIFMAIYEMTLDTLFICFCEDSERNDGSLEKPFFMSKGLQDYLGKHNAKAPVQVKGKE